MCDIADERAAWSLIKTPEDRFRLAGFLGVLGTVRAHSWKIPALRNFGSWACRFFWNGIDRTAFLQAYLTGTEVFHCMIAGSIEFSLRLKVSSSRIAHNR